MRNNRLDTEYSRHIFDTGHTHGSIENTITILRKAKKGKFLNTLEKYHIFFASKHEIHMDEFGVDHNNPIYETVYQQLKRVPPQIAAHRPHPSPIKQTNPPYPMVFHIDMPQDTQHKYVTPFNPTIATLYFMVALGLLAESKIGSFGGG
jgi:hypothetical protein